MHYTTFLLQIYTGTRYSISNQLVITLKMDVVKGSSVNHTVNHYVKSWQLVLHVKSVFPFKKNSPIHWYQTTYFIFIVTLIEGIKGTLWRNTVYHTYYWSNMASNALNMFTKHFSFSMFSKCLQIKFDSWHCSR